MEKIKLDRKNKDNSVIKKYCEDVKRGKKIFEKRRNDLISRLFHKTK